jgi:hypothetical protein
MQNRHAQHTNGVPTSHALPSYVKNNSCDSCLLNSASATLRNALACAKPPRPPMNPPSDIWGPGNLPSPHGLRYCLLVIDHHTNFMWVRFLKSKDDTCSERELVLVEVRHMHAWYHFAYRAFAPVLKFDYDSVFKAYARRQMCGILDGGVQFSAPYAHHMLRKAERPWRTIQDNAFAMMHNMLVPTAMRSCAVSTLVYFRNLTFSRAVGPSGGVPLTLLTEVEPIGQHHRHVVRKRLCRALVIPCCPL